MKFLVDPFSLHFFLTKKSTQKNIFRCFSVCFLIDLFSFIIFHAFFFHQFYLSSLFSFHLFVHLLLLFSPLSFLSFSTFFLYFTISVFLFLFFSLSQVSLSFFSIAVLTFLLFVLTHFSFLSFVLDLICFDFLLLYSFFFHLRICLCPQKKLCDHFSRRNSVFLFFLPSLLRCLISCFSFLFASSCFPCLFHVFLIFRVSWCYFSWFF